MRIIYKYRLPIDGDTIVINECIEQILAIQNQVDKPTMWAIVNTEKKGMPLEITAIGTGWSLPPEFDRYIGTLQDYQGYVWHYFTTSTKSNDMEGLFDACM